MCSTYFDTTRARYYTHVCAQTGGEKNGREETDVLYVCATENRTKSRRHYGGETSQRGLRVIN
jgi:hypothetical protein